MASIELKNVIKRYGSGKTANQVIHGVSAQIADGEFIVIVGPSGCGKSTLLRMVAGLEEVSDGQVCIGGKVVNDLEPSDRDIAMVFQNYALYPHMSVFENMAYGLKIANVPLDEIKARVDKAAKILELAPYLDRKPKALSGGQRQRIAIARALVPNPRILILDEATSALDGESELAIQQAIEGLKGRMTILVIAHRLSTITGADQLVVLENGRVMEAAPPVELLQNKQSYFYRVSNLRN